MKDFKKSKTIKVPIYPFNVHFFLLTDIGKKHQAEVARCQKEDLEIYLYFREENPHLSDVIHELFHATEFIMHTIGQPLSEPPNETWAYLIQWLMEEYLKFMKK